MQESERTVLAARVKDGHRAEINNFLRYGFNFGFAAAFGVAYIGCCLCILEEHLHISAGIRAFW